MATGENPQITRRDVVPGMSRVVEYNGIAWFTGHSARPEFKTLATQSEAVMKRYAELFEQFGYKKENILMEYGYVRDIRCAGEAVGRRKSAGSAVHRQSGLRRYCSYEQEGLEGKPNLRRA